MEDDNSTKVSPQTQQRKTSPLKIALYTGGVLALIFAIVHPALIYLYRYRMISDKDFAKIFFVWRANEADAIMVSDKWKKIEWNSFDDSKQELVDWYNESMEKKELVGWKYPEHTPRGSLKYYTHNFHYNRTLYLPYRKVLNTINKEYMSEKYNRKSAQFYNPYIMQNNSIKDNEEYKAIEPVAKDFLEILSKIYDDKYTDDDLISDEPGLENKSELIKDIEKFIVKHKILDEKDLIKIATAEGKKVESKEYKDLVKLVELNKLILEGLKNLGKASASIFDSFAYSRGFYLFYTYNMDRELAKEKKTIEAIEKDRTLLDGEKDLGKSRIVAMAKIYREIMVKIFRYSYNNDLKRFEGLYNILYGLYGPSKALKDKKTAEAFESTEEVKKLLSFASQA